MVRENPARGFGATDVTSGTPLDHLAVIAAVRARGLAVGSPLQYFAVVGSTSDVAKELASAGAPHGTTVVADEQEAGRGRRGASRWQTPPCLSIAMSVVARSRLADPTLLGRIGSCVAVAVAEAIEKTAGVRIAVKWPNDLVAADPASGILAGDQGRGDRERERPTVPLRKVGGILVEPVVTASSPARVEYAVVGIGINVNLPAAAMSPVDAGAMPPVALVDLVGHPVMREPIMVEMLARLDDALAGWHDLTWPGWRTRYAARLAWAGAPVAVIPEAPGAPPLQGILEGIDDVGALVVRCADGTRATVMSGTVRPG